MKMIFDKNKRYKLTIIRNGQELFFTANNVQIVGELVSFVDKFGQQQIFPTAFILEAKEAKEC